MLLHSQLARRIVFVLCGLLLASEGPIIGAQFRRVHNGPAGISMIAPAGWQQLSPGLGDERRSSTAHSTAAERQAFLERTADTPPTILLLFAKDLNVEDPLQTPSILIRVQRMGPLGQRPIAELIAAMEAQRDPQIVGPIRVAQVSGLPAIHATRRETVRVGASTFPVLAHGYFVPLGTVMLVIDMKAPEASPEATNQVFAEALASIRIER